MSTLNINLSNNATTQYTNYNFNSMVKFNGMILGAKSDGLFNLAGDSDNGVSIEAYFMPVMTDFGLDQPKRLRYLYVSFESQGNLSIDVQFDEGVTRTYKVESSKTGQQKRRVTVGRDGQGWYAGLTFKNINGTDFSIDGVKALIVPRSHGIL